MARTYFVNRHDKAGDFSLPLRALESWLLGGYFLLTSICHAASLSPLASAPDWKKLEQFRKTIAHDEFVQLLDTVYAPGGAAKSVIEVMPEAVRIQTSNGNISLDFAHGNAGRPPRYWTPASARKPAARPLAGVSIALDPGHIGGEWAKLEERWFQIGEQTQPVTEGDMTLRVAKLLAPRLEALGADVTFVRQHTEPVTNLRPADLRDAAAEDLKKQGLQFIHQKYNGAADPLKFSSIDWTSELLFYRTAEIRRRAQLVNRKLQPDLVLCLHFNAESWGDPDHPALVEKNHMHLLVNGSYNNRELAQEDVLFEMLLKLLNRSASEELPAAERIATALAQATGLPPYEYTNGNAHRVGTTSYVWARNLLANRLYACPVVYIEPYVMNSPAVWRRVQLGDYQGEKNVDGAMRKSIYREYADAVAGGLADYYKSARGSLEKVPK